MLVRIHTHTQMSWFLSLASSHMHTSFSQNIWLNLAQSPCVTGPVFYHCLSPHTPAPTASTAELRHPHLWFIYLFFFFFHLWGREHSVFMNSYWSLCSNRLHYVVRAKTPVSHKILWGVTFFLTANSKQFLRCCLLARATWKRSAHAKFTSEYSAQNWKSPPHSRH